MNNIKWFIMAAATAAFQWSGVCSSSAQELYPAFVSAVRISTNTMGNLTYQGFGNRDIIRNCAAEAGLTNSMGLSLVYDRMADKLEVVSGTNHTVVCTPLTFNGGVSLSNTNDTRIERVTFAYWENSTVANGTLSATERLAHDTNGITFFSLQGQLQFGVPANGTNAPAIYRGNLAAGSDLFDEDDQDRGGHGDHGGQGGHGD